MAKIIAIANQKGGCTKTNVTVNLGIGLAGQGYKVALVDNDAQGSLTASLGYVEPDDINVTIANIMMNVINDDENEPAYGILHHNEGVDLIPANIELSGLEVSLTNVISRETMLMYDKVTLEFDRQQPIIPILYFDAENSIIHSINYVIIGAANLANKYV